MSRYLLVNDFVCLVLFEKVERSWREKLDGAAWLEQEAIDYSDDLWTAGGVGVDTLVSVGWSALKKKWLYRLKKASRKKQKKAGTI
jgi:hypothetical protein